MSTTPVVTKPVLTISEKLDFLLLQQEIIIENQEELQKQVELIRDRLESLDTFEDLPIEDYERDRW